MIYRTAHRTHYLKTDNRLLETNLISSVEIRIMQIILLNNETFVWNEEFIMNRCVELGFISESSFRGKWKHLIEMGFIVKRIDNNIVKWDAYEWPNLVQNLDL